MHKTNLPNTLLCQEDKTTTMKVCQVLIQDYVAETFILDYIKIFSWFHCCDEPVHWVVTCIGALLYLKNAPRFCCNLENVFVSCYCAIAVVLLLLLLLCRFSLKRLLLLLLCCNANSQRKGYEEQWKTKMLFVIADN